MSRLTPFADAALAAATLPPATTAAGAARAAMPRSDAGEPPRAGGRGIAMHGIGKRFGAAEVLRDVDLHIAPGEFCVFVGPSGCGKSTLLRIVAGLESATSGRLEFDGRDVGDLPPADRDVAMVFQSYALYPHMDVRENLSFGLRHRRLPRGEIEARVGRAAAMLGLEPLLGRRPRELSGGQRQRVAIGRAIVREPSVFLFDEPLSNLDAALRTRTRIEIARLHREIGGASMVYVTHDQVEAMTLADRIVLLRPLADAAPGAPSIAQAGRPMDLYLRPANRFVAGFIGSPAMNFMPARLHAAGGGEVVVDVLGTRLALRAAAGAARPGDALTLGVRPEHLSLGAVDDADRTTAAGGAPGPLATVLHVEQFGDHAVAHVRPDAAADLVLLARCAGPVPGGRVRLCWAPGMLHLFDAHGVALVRP